MTYRLRQFAPAVCMAVGGVSTHCVASDPSKRVAELEAELRDLKLQIRGPEVHRVMLTGGPCGGKTSAANALREKFENIGYSVYCVPEAATLLFENMGLNGGDFFGPDKADKTLEFQIQLARLQIALENAAIDLAKQAGREKNIVLIDRGLMDGKAYCPDGVWPIILEELGMTTSMARDKRYDAVIHMVTAADGAEQFFGNENNAIRHESVEEALSLDKKTVNCWVGHEHLYVIDNSTDFEGKLKRVVSRILRHVGEPDTGHTIRKYALTDFITKVEGFKSLLRFHAPDLAFAEFVVEQTFITENKRIRKRTQEQHCSYYLQEHIGGGRVERQLKNREYRALLATARKNNNPTITKDLITFKYQDHYYEVNFFAKPNAMVVVEVEAEDTTSEISMPPFIPTSVVTEVTDDRKFSSFHQAQLLQEQQAKAASAAE